MLYKYLNDFLKYLEIEKGYSKNTKISYENGLKKFIAFLSNEGIHSFSNVNCSIFIKFIHCLENSGLSQGSIKLYIESCKSFFKFLKQENIINENCLSQIGRRKIENKIPETLSVDEIEAIIDSLHFDDEIELLYRAIIELLYGSGLRVSEVCNLRVSDFNFNKGSVSIKCAKGGKDRIVPCGSSSLNTLQEYWMTYRDPFPKDEDFAFINAKTGFPLTRNQIFCKIRRIIEKCGIQKKVSPHTFRHSFATHLIRNGADIRVVQEMLGHASINSTQIYINLDLGDIQSSFQKCHLRYKPDIFLW